jgi:hypothetical protein
MPGFSKVQGRGKDLLKSAIMAVMTACLTLVFPPVCLLAFAVSIDVWRKATADLRLISNSLMDDSAYYDTNRARIVAILGVVANCAALIAAGVFIAWSFSQRT